MASKAHAFFCFEVLKASYDDQPYPNLEVVLDLYEQYEHGMVGDLQEDDGDIQQAPIALKLQDQSDGIERRIPQLQSISRLQESTPFSGSTTSTLSVNSSNTHLTTSSMSIESTSPSYSSRLSLTQSYPLFVTWNTSKSGHKSLRGCIGTFEALPLEKGLESYALTSAFEDTRFSPIAAHLLPNLSCSLTLLADFEDCNGPIDWELGKHGIRISFTHRNRRYGATYLPDVAVEQGWSKEETLESLMRKAGWESTSRRLSKGSSKPWEDSRDFKVIRYTGLKASATYTEWQDWQKWAREKNPASWS